MKNKFILFIFLAQVCHASEELPQKPVKSYSFETHDHDGLLKERYKKLKKFEDTLEGDRMIPPLPSLEETTEKMAAALKSLSKLPAPLRTQSQKALDLIKSGAGNHDASNDIDAALLLRQVWRLMKTAQAEEMALFMEKLAEIISGGQCAQGRVARIYPFYESALAGILIREYTLPLDHFFREACHPL